MPKPVVHIAESTSLAFRVAINLKVLEIAYFENLLFKIAKLNIPKANKYIIVKLSFTSQDLGADEATNQPPPPLPPPPFKLALEDPQMAFPHCSLYKYMMFEGSLSYPSVS